MELNKRESLLVRETIISLMQLIGEMKDCKLMEFIIDCRKLNEKATSVGIGDKTCQRNETKI